MKFQYFCASLSFSRRDEVWLLNLNGIISKAKSSYYLKKTTSNLNQNTTVCTEVSFQFMDFRSHSWMQGKCFLSATYNSLQGRYFSLNLQKCASDWWADVSRWLKYLYVTRLQDNLSLERRHVKRGRNGGALEIISSSSRKVMSSCMSLLLEGFLQVQNHLFLSLLNISRVLDPPQSKEIVYYWCEVSYFSGSSIVSALGGQVFGELCLGGVYSVLWASVPSPGVICSWESDPCAGIVLVAPLGSRWPWGRWSFFVCLSSPSKQQATVRKRMCVMTKYRPSGTFTY